MNKSNKTVTNAKLTPKQASDAARAELAELVERILDREQPVPTPPIPAESVPAPAGKPRPDHLHFTPAGYRELGKRSAEKERDKGSDGHGSKVIVIPFDGAVLDRDLPSSADSTKP